MKCLQAAYHHHHYFSFGHIQIHKGKNQLIKKKRKKQRGNLPVNWARKSSIVYGEKTLLEDVRALKRSFNFLFTNYKRQQQIKICKCQKYSDLAQVFFDF